MGEKLQNPPLLEAVCEFRFAQPTPWDWTIPGRLYDLLDEQFPGRSEATLPLPGNQRVVQLRRLDGSAMVQVGERLLAVNHLRPYTDWATYRDLILTIFQKCCGLIAPVTLARLGLRYINQLETPGESFQIGELLTLDPPLSGPLKRPLKGFYQRYEVVQESPRGVLIHQTGLQNAGGQQLVMLDLDFGSEDVKDVQSVQAVRTWLDLAHERVLEAFVASLPPSVYEAMKRGRK
jgi:uncharacterized protein (TIGR04255 family)